MDAAALALTSDARVPLRLFFIAESKYPASAGGQAAARLSKDCWVEVGVNLLSGSIPFPADGIIGHVDPTTATVHLIEGLKATAWISYRASSLDIPKPTRPPTTRGRKGKRPTHASKRKRK